MRRPLLVALLALVVASGAAGALTITPAPAPGPLGPEGVPVPKGDVFANVRPVKLGQTIDGVTCQSAERIAVHIHAHLPLFVGERAYQVPYGIGMGPPVQGVQTADGPFATRGSCFMWLHTHASDGIIHVEAPKLHRFTLGQFFDVWGVKLARSGVGPAKGKVTAFYNGEPWAGSLGAIPLTNEAQIQLDVGSPVVAPEHIVFPKGLVLSMSKSK